MQIAPRCYAVTGLGYLPPWTVNAGFIAGTHTTLVIDTGANAAAAATILGYATAVSPSNRILALNTERHFDHIGGNSYLRRHNIEIYAHPAAVRTQEEFAAEIEEFNAAILDPVRRDAHEAGAFYAGTQLATPTHFLDAETAFPLGGITAQIVFTPGHTPSNISVLADGVLYSGDCLINRYLPNLSAGREPEWRQWLDSLDRIERLAPHAVVPGHGPVLTGGGVSAAIDAVRAALNHALHDPRKSTK